MIQFISYSKNRKKAEIINNKETKHIHKITNDIWMDNELRLYTIEEKIGKPEPIRVKMDEILS